MINEGDESKISRLPNNTSPMACMIMSDAAVMLNLGAATAAGVSAERRLPYNTSGRESQRFCRIGDK